MFSRIPLLPQTPAASFTGEGVGVLSPDSTNLVLVAAAAAFAHLRVQAPPALRIACHNSVPVGAGMGSSSAAIVAGVVAAFALCGRLPAGACATVLHCWSSVQHLAHRLWDSYTSLCFWD